MNIPVYLLIPSCTKMNEFIKVDTKNSQKSPYGFKGNSQGLQTIFKVWEIFVIVEQKKTRRKYLVTKEVEFLQGLFSGIILFPGSSLAVLVVFAYEVSNKILNIKNLYRYTMLRFGVRNKCIETSYTLYLEHYINSQQLDSITNVFWHAKCNVHFLFMVMK